jgi:hypothetical protein
MMDVSVVVGAKTRLESQYVIENIGFSIPFILLLF